LKKELSTFFFYKDIQILLIILFVNFLYVWVNFQWEHLLFIVIGMVIFIISEYGTHRFLFHLKPPKNVFLFKLLHRLHYAHHEKPSDLKLLFLPLWYSIPNLCLLSSFCFLITKSFNMTLYFSFGLIFMLLIYEWKHFVAHRSIKPVTLFGRKLKKRHLLHHFKNENYWFGVSTHVMDIVFHTDKEEKEVEVSKTAKQLASSKKGP